VSPPCKNDRPENPREGKTYLICTAFHCNLVDYTPAKLLWQKHISRMATHLEMALS
jgi:hypothetical protein